MSSQQKSDLPVSVKQIEGITPANKRYMIYLITTMLFLCGAIIISSFTLI